MGPARARRRERGRDLKVSLNDCMHRTEHSFRREIRCAQAYLRTGEMATTSRFSTNMSSDNNFTPITPFCELSMIAPINDSITFCFHLFQYKTWPDADGRGRKETTKRSEEQEAMFDRDSRRHLAAMLFTDKASAVKWVERYSYTIWIFLAECWAAFK